MLCSLLALASVLVLVRCFRALYDRKDHSFPRLFRGSVGTFSYVQFPRFPSGNLCGFTKTTHSPPLLMQMQIKIEDHQITSRCFISGASGKCKRTVDLKPSLLVPLAARYGLDASVNLLPKP